MPHYFQQNKTRLYGNQLRAVTASGFFCPTHGFVLSTNHWLNHLGYLRNNVMGQHGVFYTGCEADVGRVALLTFG